MRVSLPSVLMALAISLGSIEGRAESGEPVSIRVEGLIPCTSEADFLARVRRRAPGARTGQPDEPTRTFTIRLEGSAPSMQGRLSIVHLDGRSSTRDVTGESCADVVDALALITAVDIDPDAARSAPNESPVPAPLLPSPEPPAPPVVPPTAPRVWHLAVGIEPSVTARVAPGVLWGLPIFLELASPPAGPLSPSFAIGFERTFNSTTETTVGDASFDLVQGFLQTCPLAFGSTRWWVGPCARIDAGVLQAAGKRGKGLVTARPESGSWYAIGLAGRGTYRLGGPVYLNAQFGLGFPLVPYDYKFDPDTSVGQAMPWNWRAGLGLAVRFL